LHERLCKSKIRAARSLFWVSLPAFAAEAVTGMADKENFSFLQMIDEFLAHYSL